MVNKHYQKHKERLWKEARERYQSLSEEGKDNKKKLKKEVKMFLKTKKKKGINIIRNIKISYASKEEIII